MSYLFGRSNPSTENASVNHQTEENPSTKNASVDYQTEETEEPNLLIRYWDRGTGKSPNSAYPNRPEARHGCTNPKMGCCP